MSLLLPHKPEILDRFLFETRTLIENSDIKANPFFVFVKPTEETVSKYRFHKSESYLFLIFDIIFFFPRLVLEVIYSSAVSILWHKKTYQSQPHSKLKCESLFVSHYTTAQSKSDKDIFFGSAVESPHSHVFYLNHTRENTNKIIADLKRKNMNRFFVNAKTFTLMPTLKTHFRQFKVSWPIFKHALGRKNLLVSQRRILLRGARFQHSRPTLANLILRDRLMNLMFSLQPERLVITLEGHAHEAMLIDLREVFFPRTQIVAYQHAPVVPSQFNIKRIVSLLRSSDLVLTSGLITKGLFLHAQPRARVEILGSPKAKEFAYQTKDVTRLRVLLVPEAARESLMDFALLGRHLAINFPSASLTLRLHPDTEKKLLIATSKILNGLPNIQISELPLSADLKSSHVTLFRSSAAAIEGLAYGSLPIHFESGGSGNLNPLFDSQFSVPTFYNYSDLVYFLENLDISKSHSQIYQKESFKKFSLYYSELHDFNALIRRAILQDQDS